MQTLISLSLAHLMVSVKQASFWDVRIGIDMYFEVLLKSVRSFVLSIWDARKVILVMHSLIALALVL